jgi:hypothetical protein
MSKDAPINLPLGGDSQSFLGQQRHVPKSEQFIRF